MKLNKGKNLSSLLKDVKIINQKGGNDPLVLGLAYDSRDVKPGYIFFALKGFHTDGHEYIEKAIVNGAVAVFHSDDLNKYYREVVYIKVQNTRYIMSPVSSAFYDYPSGKMKIIGVTGTNGKSTTVFMIYQLLSMAGFKTGFISTIQFDSGEGPVKNHYRQSTPEATEIHKILYKMVNNGCTHAVVEATSHGLSFLNNRLGDVNFDGAVYTNISHEHLEFHKTVDKYVDDKANLFRLLDDENGFGIVNKDDSYFHRFMEAAKAEVFSYGITNKDSDMSAGSIRGSGNNTNFNVLYKQSSYAVHLNVPPIFNVENSLAALLSAIKLTGENIETFLPFMEKLVPAEGRMITLNSGQPFRVIIDYAHSPGSFEILFPALREMTTGRLIAVFGSAGERDNTKGRIQGIIANKYSDIIILTDEDPRGDDPMEIIKYIASGCSGKIEGENLFLIENRKDAIRKAFTLGRNDDLIVLLGKGHESTIIYKDGPVPWKEKDVAEGILQEIGYKKTFQEKG